MQKTTSKLDTTKSTEELIEAQLLLHEAIELIETSRQLFNTQLTNLEGQLKQAQSQEEKVKIEKKAQALYVEYKSVFSELEACITDIYSIFSAN